MATPPKNRKESHPARNVNNLYDRLEDARKRRAEAMALKTPANDSAPVPKTQPIPLARPTQAFPKIVMPEPEEIVAEAPPKKSPRFGLVIASVLALAALAVLALTQDQTGPAQAPNVEQAAAPENIPSATPPSASNDAPPSQSPSALPAVEIASASQLAPEAFLPKPQITNLRPPFAAPIGTDLAVSINAEDSFRPDIFVSAPAAPSADFAFVPNQPVILQISLNIPASANRAEVNEITRALEESRHQLNTPRTVDYVIRNTQVRYYHQSDAIAAQQLADGVSGVLRDFTDYRPSPPQGLVEIFIAGRSTTTTPREPEGLASDLRQLRDNIRNALRSITR